MWSRLLGTFTRRRREREVDDELQSHIEMHVADGIAAGLTAEEARRQALAKLGGLTATRDASRDRLRVPLVESAWRDLRMAARSLRRAPGLTAVAIVPLALAIAVGTCTFSAVEGVLLRPLPYAQPDRLFLVFQDRSSDLASSPGTWKGALTPAAFDAWSRQGHTFTQLAWYASGLHTLRTPDGPVRIGSSAVSANLLDLLGAAPALGRFFRQDDVPARDVAILGNTLWRQQFASDPHIVGRSIVMDDRPYTVIGIAAPEFYFPARGTALWTISGDPRDASAIVRLAPGVSRAQAEAEASAIAARADAPDASKEAEKSGFALGRVELTSLLENETGAIRQPLIVLMCAALVLLLVAAINAASLLLVRSLAQTRERAVRAALGASIGRLVGDALLQNGLIGLLSGGAGLALAFAIDRARATFLPADFPRQTDIAIDAHVILFAAGAALTAIAIASLIPVWRLVAGRDLRGAMQASSVAAHAGLDRARPGWTAAGLLIAEIGFSCALLIASGLLVRSFLKLASVDPGYRPDGVIEASVGFPPSMSQADRRDRSSRLLDRLRAATPVIAAGFTSSLPLESVTVTYTLDGHDDRATLRVAYRVISPGYLEAIGARVLAGRGFTDDDVAGSPVVVLVNEAFARRYFPGRAPVGLLVPGTERKPMHIVGLVEDMHDDGLAKDVEPTLYVPFPQAGQNAFLFNRLDVAVRTTGDPSAFAPTLRGVAREIDDGLPVYQVTTMTRELGDSVARPRFYAVLMASLAGFTIAITAVGLFGALAYDVARRRRELAIRMALGAQPHAIVAAVLRDLAVVTSTGIVLGLVIGFATSRVLSSLLFGLAPRDPLTFGLAPIVVVLAAVAALIVPIRRALRLDPASVLRAD